MKRRSGSHFLVATGAAALAYMLVIRPRLLSWGATEAEVLRPMPGDEYVPHPRIESTRSITIQAPAADVWPWLVQIGYQRAGWYSYDLLEKAIGVADFVDGRSARRIIPELQHLQVGDIIKTDPGGGFLVAAVEPARLLALRARIDAFTGRHRGLSEPLRGACFDISWVFTLHEIDRHSTRLTVRFRAGYRPSLPNRLIARLVFEPVIFFMERKMLLGLKERAEGAWALSTQADVA